MPEQALSNPTTEQIDLRNQALTPSSGIATPPSRQIAREQLSFTPDRKYGLQQVANSIKYYIKRREVEIELMPFWRGLGTPFALVSTVITFVITFFAGIINFNKFGSNLPFYYNSIESRWQDTDKSIILFFPIAYGIIMTIILRLIFEIFKYDHRFSNILSWVVTVVNILLLVAVGQIYSLTRAS